MLQAAKLSRIRAAFPLFMREELEVPVNQMGYVIGVNKDYPAQLREMISAAAITYQLQNRSIDHVRRTYLKGLDYEEDPGGEKRLDRLCRQACDELFAASDAFLKVYPPLTKGEPLVGEWIGDLTLLRIGYSFERAFAEADKGALYESVAIARMIIEQLCWSLAVRQLNYVEHIKRKSATRCVGEVSRNLPMVGRLYGWMSDHAHWAYSAHLKVIATIDSKSAAMFASNYFKAVAYSLLIVLAEVYRLIFGRIVENERKRSLSQTRRAWSRASRRYKPQRLIAKIVQISGQAADVVSLQQVLADGYRHG